MKLLKSSRVQAILRWFTNEYIARIPSRRLRHAWYRQFYTLGPGANIMMRLRIRKLTGITLGRNTNVSPDCMFNSQGGPIIIGDYCDIAPEVNIWTADHDLQAPDFRVRSGGVTVGNYVWICNRAIILTGVSIGEGAVVAAGAVVTKDVPPWSIVGGIPAKVIGQRNPDQMPRPPFRPFFY